MIRLECIVRIAVGSEGNLCRSMQELKGERSKMFRCPDCGKLVRQETLKDRHVYRCFSCGFVKEVRFRSSYFPMGRYGKGSKF